MSYIIEDGFPAPPKAKRTVPPKSALRLALEALQPGQSVLLESAEEYDRARSAASYVGGSRFVSRKVPGKGWRVWRTE